jgi:hypothetical protein
MLLINKTVVTQLESLEWPKTLALVTCRSRGIFSISNIAELDRLSAKLVYCVIFDSVQVLSAHNAKSTTVETPLIPIAAP